MSWAINRMRKLLLFCTYVLTKNSFWYQPPSASATGPTTSRPTQLSPPSPDTWTNMVSSFGEAPATLLNQREYEITEPGADASKLGEVKMV